MTLRLAKVVMVFSLAAFAFIVTFDNITDYGSNFAFVRHVMSMDTTFSHNNLLYRSITRLLLWHLACDLILLVEGLTCIAFALGAVMLLRSLQAEAAVSNMRRDSRSSAQHWLFCCGSQASWWWAASSQSISFPL